MLLLCSKQLGADKSSSSVAVSLCSTLFYKTLKDSLHSSGLSQSVIDNILHSLVMKGSGTPDPKAQLAVAEAVAKGVQTAFIVPIVSGVLSFCVALLHRWKKIGNGGETTEPSAIDPNKA